VAGVRIRRLTDLDIDADATVLGTPAAVQDGTLGTGMVDSFAGTTYAALAASANIILTGNNERLSDVRPRSSGATCTTSNRENWGAPESPGSVCWSYLPIIHARRNLRLDGEGTGQGILLVDGNLVVQDEFHFYGLIVVQGRINVENDSQLRGAILAGNNDVLSQQTRLLDESIVRYSSCALSRVLPPSSAGTVELLPGRHWFEIP
jgi:hypothetical protein